MIIIVIIIILIIIVIVMIIMIRRPPLRGLRPVAQQGLHLSGLVGGNYV